MIRSMVRYRVRIPRELVLLSKQMLYLEGAAHTLAPDLDLLEEQQVIYNALMTKYPELGIEIMQAIARSAEVDSLERNRG
jgi:predicted unusual protein kinase regulating ubiquinone biosynthesis (AarF/ABC1/UbiB family)